MKQSAMFYSALILLPLALTAPTPRGFATDFVARGFPKSVCDPTRCDPVEFPPEPPVVVTPIIGCDPQFCDPDISRVGLSVDHFSNKRSALPEPDSGSSTSIIARADISTTPPTRPVPEPDAIDRLKARRHIGIGSGLTMDGGDKIVKRSRDPLPPPDPECPNCLGRRSPHWTNGVVPRLGALERSGTGVNNGKRDGEERGFEVGNGIAIESRNPNGAFGGGGGVYPGLQDADGTEIGNGIVIGSKIKRGTMGVGGGSVSTAHWGVGNGREADKRANSGTAVNNGVVAEDASDAVGNGK